MEGGEENGKLEEFEGVLDQEKVLKVVEEEGLSKNALGIMGKESRLRGKLSYKGKVSKEFKDEIDSKEGNVNTKVYKKPGRDITKGIFLKHQTSSLEQESEYSNRYRSTKAYNAQGAQGHWLLFRANAIVST
ncbi:hypothetical protein SLA2020_442060 [Shorea laevis]